MLEIGIHLASTLKSLFGCMTVVYVINQIIELLKSPSALTEALKSIKKGENEIVR